MAETQKRNVIITITDKGLKEVTSGLTNLHKIITSIEKNPIDPMKGAAKSVKSTEKAAAGVKRYENSISEADRAAKSFANTNSKGAKDFSKQAQGLGGLVHIYATVAANIWALGTAFNQLRESANLEAVIQAQKQLEIQTGKSLGAVTRSLQQGTDGALSLANSMRLANTVVSAGFGGKFADDVAKIAGGASKALGRDLTDAVTRLTRGIAKMEPEILDELGLFVKLEVATRKYAEENNKLVKDLTEFERRQAFANEATRQGIELYGDLSANVETNPYDQLSSSLVNVKDKILSVVSATLAGTGVIQSFAGSMAGMSGILFLLVQRLANMAIPELANFGSALRTKAVDKMTSSIAALDKVQEELAANNPNMLDEGGTDRLSNSFDGLKTKAKLTGQHMHSSFLLGASGVKKASLEVQATNAQLAILGPRANKAASAMFLLGSAVNKIGKGVSFLIKAAGKLAIFVTIFTAVSGVLSKVLDHFGLLDGFIRKWDQLKEFTGFGTPSAIEALSEAVEGLDKNTENAIEGFTKLSIKSERSFIAPVRTAGFLTNALNSIRDEVQIVRSEFNNLTTSSVGIKAALKGVNTTLEVMIKRAKELGQTDLADSIENIQNAMNPTSRISVKSSLNRATELIEESAKAAAIASSELEGQEKAVESLNSSTKAYLDTLRSRTKLDTILEDFDKTGFTEFIDRLGTKESFELAIETGEASKELQELADNAENTERKLKGIITEIGGETKGTPRYTRLIQQQEAYEGALQNSLDALETYLFKNETASSKLGGLSLAPNLTESDVKNFVANMASVGEGFFEVLNLTENQVTAIKTLIATVEEGGSINLLSAGATLDPLVDAAGLVLETSVRQREVAIQIQAIQSKTAADALANSEKQKRAGQLGTVGLVSQDDTKVAKLKLSLLGEEEARRNRIAKITQEIAQLSNKVVLQQGRKTEESKRTVDSLNRDISSQQKILSILQNSSNAHEDISEKLIAQLEHSQELQLLTKTRLEDIRAIAAAEQDAAELAIAQKEAALSIAQTISPNTNFADKEAELAIDKAISEIEILRIQEKENQLMLDEQISAIQDKYIADGVILHGQDLLAVTALQNKKDGAARVLANAEKLNALKLKELAIDKEIAKITTPFENLEKILSKLDKNGFSKLIKGASAFAKVTQVNAALLKNMRKDDKGYIDQQLAGYAEQSAALGGMFEEGSDAARAFGALEQGIHIARMATFALENAAMLSNMAASIAATLGILPAKAAGATGAIVEQAGIPGIAIAAGFVATMFALAGKGGGGGGSGNKSAARVEKQIKAHNDNLGANKVSGAAELETNALTGSITDLVEIDTRLYTSMDNLQHSIVELGQTFKSIGSSSSRAFGGFTIRGLNEQFEDLPEFGAGIIENGAYKRPKERELEDVLLEIDPIISPSSISPSALKKASDFLSADFSNIMAVILAKTTTRKASDGSLKGVSLDEHVRQLTGDYADVLSVDLFNSFTSTIDTTFGLLEALDPGAHIGAASGAFSTDLATSLISSFNEGAFGADLSSLISVKDLSSSEAADRISVYFNGLSDDMIRSIFPVLDNFRQAGEELGDTLARMVSETAAAINGFSLLGFAGSIFDPAVMGQAGVEANIAFQSGLFRGFEDTDAWAELAQDFTDVILTEKEALENLIVLIEGEISRGLNTAIAQLSDIPAISGVSTLSAELTVLARDMEAGAITSGQALKGFKTIWDQYTQVVGAAAAGVDLSGSLLDEQALADLGALDSIIMSTVVALGSLIDTEEQLLASEVVENTGKTLEDFLDLIASIRSTVADLLLGELSPLAPKQQVDVAQNAFESLVTQINTETDDAKRLLLLEGLESAALDYLDLSKDYYGGAGNYISEFERVRNTLSEIADSVEAEFNIDPAVATVGLLEDIYDLEERSAQEIQDALQAILDTEAATLDALRLIYLDELGREPDSGGLDYFADQVARGISSLEDIIAIINDSPEGVRFDATTANPDFLDQITQFYADELGRVPDQGGLDFWIDRYLTGINSLSEIGTLINDSPEGVLYDSLPQLGIGGIASTPSIAGEAGPEAVVPLPDGRSIPVSMQDTGDNSSSVVVEELRQLVNEVQGQSIANREILEEIAATLEEANFIAGNAATERRNTARQLIEPNI